MTDITEAPVYGLFLEFAEPELVETKARADEAVRAIEQLDGVVAELIDEGVEVRGFYDLTGFDAVGSVLVWLRATSVTDLQWAQRQLRRTLLLGDTMLVNARITAELTVVDEEPGGWLNLVEAGEPSSYDRDFDYGDDLLDVVDEGEAVDHDYFDEPALTPAERQAEAAAVGATDGADELDEPDELDDDELDGVDPRSLPGRALLSLHARIGIGPLRYLVVAEADAAIGLIGELGRPFGDDVELELLGDGEVGRLITTAELFEVLR